jgi:hypothetical protein
MGQGEVLRAALEREQRRSGHRVWREQTLLAFDLKTADVGTSGEFAVQVGNAASPAWCQGGKWVWTNPNFSRIIATLFGEMSCPAGSTTELTQTRAVSVFVKAGTFTIDQVRAE